jgi:hypothetical protein
MAANTVPVFTKVGVIGMAQVASANTARDGTGTTADVVTGATEGTRIERIVIKATVTTTAGMVRLFLVDTNPTTRLLAEQPIAAITVSASVAAAEYTIYFPYGLILPNGWKIIASTEKAEAINVFAFGGNY